VVLIFFSSEYPDKIQIYTKQIKQKKKNSRQKSTDCFSLKFIKQT